MKIWVRAECRYVNTPSTNGELAETREQLGQIVAKRAAYPNRAIRAVDADVHVQPERVVPPDDVAQQLVVAAVVRRVDDSLLLPRAPRMRAGRREPDAERIGERAQLRAPLADALHALGERVAAAGAHLGLGCDQLADEMRLELGAAPRPADLLEAADEAERRRIEQRELLLDRDGEVGNVLEPGLRGGQQLLVADLLLVAHRRKPSPDEAARAGARPRGSSSSCARLHGAPRGRALGAVPGSASSSAARGERSRVAARERRERASAGGYSAAMPAATSASPE